MTNDRIKKGIEDIKEIRLTALEKRAMFERLLAYTESHPALAPVPTYKWQLAFRQLVGYRRQVSAGLAIALLLVASGGTIFASDDALPGDLLYPVKVGVAEPLRDVIARGPAEKAKWETEKADRRLDEAERMAAKGQLDDRTARMIEDRLGTHLKQFNTLEQEIKKTAPAEQAVDVHTDFEARMGAHARILSELGGRSGSSQKGKIDQIEKAVKEQTEKASRSRAEIETKYIEEKQNRGPGKGNDFMEKQRKIDENIREARQQLERDMEQARGVQRDILEQASSSLNKAEEHLKSAEKRDNRGPGRGDEDYTSQLSAERAAEEARISIEKSSKFDERDGGRGSNSDRGKSEERNRDQERRDRNERERESDNRDRDGD